MAKLILSFKGHLISTHPLGQQPVTIGRDLDCEIHIDSLAISPRHALIAAHPDGYSIAAMAPGHPVALNNEQVEQAPLHNGDLIRIGKHTLYFAEGGQEAATPAPPQAATAGAGRAAARPCTAFDLAYVQIQSGPKLGRVLALRRDSTRLTRAGAGQVVITRRNDGYFVACDDRNALFGVNGEPAGPNVEVPLVDAAVIKVDDLRCQFFRRGAGAS